tara:strand:+ start:1511 stop:1699 length:189 start_codon:yes stop_codon:yes gene_type:complete
LWQEEPEVFCLTQINEFILLNISMLHKFQKTEIAGTGSSVLALIEYPACIIKYLIRRSEFIY